MNFNNIHIRGIPESEWKEQGIKILVEETMTENFPDLLKKMRHKTRKHRESETDGSTEAPTKHSIIKMAKLRRRRSYKP